VRPDVGLVSLNQGQIGFALASVGRIFHRSTRRFAFFHGGKRKVAPGPAAATARTGADAGFAIEYEEVGCIARFKNLGFLYGYASLPFKGADARSGVLESAVEFARAEGCTVARFVQVAVVVGPAPVCQGGFDTQTEIVRFCSDTPAVAVVIRQAAPGRDVHVQGQVCYQIGCDVRRRISRTVRHVWYVRRYVGTGSVRGDVMAHICHAVSRHIVCSCNVRYIQPAKVPGVLIGRSGTAGSNS
jgi:hypothetical protein